MSALDNGFEAGCFCGAVKLSIKGPPRFVYHCHCTDCRRINGTAFHTGVAVDTSDFEVVEGTPATFVCQADSGNTITRFHCAACGTNLYSVTTADESITSVKAGAVTSIPHEEIVPTMQIFWQSRVHWADAPKSLVTYEQGIRGKTPLLAGSF